MSSPAPRQPRRVSPAVYRRRRLVALLALLAIVTAVVLIIVRPGQATPTPTETAAAVKPTVAPVTTESATPTPTPTVDVSDYKECSTKNLEVMPVLDAVDYQGGVLPNLSLTIQNTGKTACFYNVGTAAQELTITSGAETYWVSTDCQSEKSDTVAILEPGVVYPSAPIVWDRQRSAPDTCGGDREVVPAGGASYYLTTKVGGVSSKSSAQFLLY